MSEAGDRIRAFDKFLAALRKVGWRSAPLFEMGWPERVVGLFADVDRLKYGVNVPVAVADESVLAGYTNPEDGQNFNVENWNSTGQPRQFVYDLHSTSTPDGHYIVAPTAYHIVGRYIALAWGQHTHAKSDVQGLTETLSDLSGAVEDAQGTADSAHALASDAAAAASSAAGAASTAQGRADDAYGLAGDAASAASSAQGTANGAAQAAEDAAGVAAGAASAASSAQGTANGAAEVAASAAGDASSALEGVGSLSDAVDSLNGKLLWYQWQPPVLASVETLPGSPPADYRYILTGAGAHQYHIAIDGGNGQPAYILPQPGMALWDTAAGKYRKYTTTDHWTDLIPPSADGRFLLSPIHFFCNGYFPSSITWASLPVGFRFCVIEDPSPDFLAYHVYEKVDAQNTLVDVTPEGGVPEGAVSVATCGYGTYLEGNPNEKQVLFPNRGPIFFHNNQWLFASPTPNPPLYFDDWNRRSDLRLLYDRTLRLITENQHQYLSVNPDFVASGDAYPGLIAALVTGSDEADALLAASLLQQDDLVYCYSHQGAGHQSGVFWSGNLYKLHIDFLAQPQTHDWIDLGITAKMLWVKNTVSYVPSNGGAPAEPTGVTVMEQGGIPPRLFLTNYRQAPIPLVVNPALAGPMLGVNESGVSIPKGALVAVDPVVHAENFNAAWQQGTPALAFESVGYISLEGLTDRVTSSMDHMCDQGTIVPGIRHLSVHLSYDTGDHLWHVTVQGLFTGPGTVVCSGAGEPDSFMVCTPAGSSTLSMHLYLSPTPVAGYFDLHVPAENAVFVQRCPVDGDALGVAGVEISSGTSGYLSFGVADVLVDVGPVTAGGKLSSPTTANSGTAGKAVVATDKVVAIALRASSNENDALASCRWSVR